MAYLSMYFSHLKHLFSKISASLLLLLVLFGSFGFTISTHFCGGEMVKSAVGFSKKDVSCGMKMSKAKCPNKNHLQKTCCQNIYDFYHLEDEFQKDAFTFSVPEYHLEFPIVAKLRTYPVRIFQNAYIIHPPPKLLQNKVVLHQSFLI